MNFTRTVKRELYNLEITRGDEIACEIIGYLSSKNRMVGKKISGKLEDDYLEKIRDLTLSDDFNLSIKGDLIKIESEFKLKDFIIKSDNQLKRAYMRGAFLASGSINNPKRSYHLEIDFAHLEEADIVEKIFNLLGLKCGITIRRESAVIYVKDRNTISDVLTLMGAVQSTLEFEDIVIINSTRNNVNRLVNCESANLTKTIVAGLQQIEAIEKLQEAGLFEKLDKNLYDIGLLRLANPDASLNELVLLSGGKLTKSGINHRLKKIMEIADKL